MLIGAVGQALPRLVGTSGFAARRHTAGDEFAVLLPGADADTAGRLAAALEASLDALEVAADAPVRLPRRSWATRSDGESPGQALGRAIAAMQERKSERRAGT